MITVGDLADIVGNLSDDVIYPIGIADVFSWRGAYTEPCFKFGENISGLHMKQVVGRALADTFCGWKGGEYQYQVWNVANFESSGGDYTDGGYLTFILTEYSDDELVKSIREHIVGGYQL